MNHLTEGIASPGNWLALLGETKGGKEQIENKKEKFTPQNIRPTKR